MENLHPRLVELLGANYEVKWVEALNPNTAKAYQPKWKEWRVRAM